MSRCILKIRAVMKHSRVVEALEESRHLWTNQCVSLATVRGHAFVRPGSFKQYPLYNKRKYDDNKPRITSVKDLCELYGGSVFESAFGYRGKGQPDVCRLSRGKLRGRSPASAGDRPSTDEWPTAAPSSFSQHAI